MTPRLNVKRNDTETKGYKSDIRVSMQIVCAHIVYCYAFDMALKLNIFNGIIKDKVRFVVGIVLYIVLYIVGIKQNIEGLLIQY